MSEVTRYTGTNTHHKESTMKNIDINSETSPDVIERRFMAIIRDEALHVADQGRGAIDWGKTGVWAGLFVGSWALAIAASLLAYRLLTWVW